MINNNGIEVVSLSKIVEEYGEDFLSNITSTFVCKRNSDIEKFLKERALEFEKLDKSRTYITFDGENNIVAYFSIALSVFEIPIEFSNRKIKNFDGFSAKNKNKILTTLPAILIGQFGKNDEFKSSLSGEDLMKFCMDIILEARGLIGGRIVILECQDNSKLIDRYKGFGFERVSLDNDVEDISDDKKNKQIQMIKLITN